MKYIPAIFIFLFFSQCTAVFAEALLSGSVNSVNPESGFNALRNPALMSRQRKDSAGFFYLHSYSASTGISADLDSGSTLADAEAEADSDEKYNGIFSISYVKRLKRNSFGFGIRKPEGTDQAVISESSFILTAVALPWKIPVKNETVEEKKSFAASTVISYSRDLGDRESAGIQLETGVSSSATTAEKFNYINGALGSNYNIDINTKQYIGNINCGYHVMADKCEIGAMIKFGDFVYEQGGYSYENKLTPFNKTEKDITAYFYKKGGLEYTLGFGYNITERFSFSLEGSFCPSFDREKKELKDDDNGLMDEKNSRIYVNYSAGAKAGFSYKYSRDLIFGFGGGAGIYSEESAGSDGIKSGETEYNIYSMTAGLEMKPAGGLSLIFGLNLYSLMVNMESKTAATMLNMEMDTLHVNLIAAASTFY